MPNINHRHDLSGTVGTVMAAAANTVPYPVIAAHHHHHPTPAPYAVRASNRMTYWTRYSPPIHDHCKNQAL